MIRPTFGPNWTKKALVYVGLLVSLVNLHAQNTEPDFFHRTPVEVKVKARDSMVAKSFPMAVGISAGTQAFYAGDFAINLRPHFNARLSYHHLVYTIKETSVDLGDEELLFNAKIHQSNVAFLAEYAIAKQSIRLVGGFAFYPDNTISGSGILGDSIQIEDVMASPDEVGFIKGTIQMGNKIAPYFGLAFGKAVPLKRIGIGLDLGTYYKGSPKVDLEATSILRNNVNNEQTLEDALAFAKWWPVFSLRLAVKIQ